MPANNQSESTRREQTTRTRRRLLIDAAVTCFVETGLARTGMRDIAAKAGVSIGNLYNHFPGRDDLIAEIARIDAQDLAAVMVEVRAEVAACESPKKAVDTFVKRYFDHCANVTSAALTVEITAEALRNPAVEQLFRETRDMLVEVLVAAIDQGKPATGPVSREVIAGLILDLIEGYALRLGLSGKKLRKRDVKALLAVVRSILSSNEG